MQLGYTQTVWLLSGMRRIEPSPLGNPFTKHAAGKSSKL